MDYELGLEVLKKLAERTSWHQQALLYEARLLDNLQDERSYGSAPQTTQERQRIIDQLNRLCMQYLQTSFNDLCQGTTPIPAPQPGKLERPLGTAICLYAQADKPFYDKLKTSLSHWQQEGKIGWLETRAGDHIIRAPRAHIQQAGLILFLCSADFFADAACQTAMMAALQERARRQVPIVPILVRACAWEESPCGLLDVLPVNKQPVSEWSQPDQAYDDIRRGLIRLSTRV